MSTLHIDFETRATADLKKQGVYKYAGHPDTDVWCLAYAFDDEPVRVWRPGEKPPAEIVTHLMLQDGPVVGHNVGFEWAIWNAILVPRYGFPKLPIEQCYCTAAMAAAMALPRDLAGAAEAVNLETGKDMEGRRLMLQMMKPRKVLSDGKLIWWDVPEKVDRLVAYCRQDVETERALEKKLLPLRPRERELWLLDHKINARGVKVDLRAVRGALDVVDVAKADYDALIAEITGGAVTAVTKAHDLAQWCTVRGVPTDSVAKGRVKELLAGILPGDVRAALLVRQEAAKSSTAKLQAMVEAASSDGRARDMFMYHGASTGRWSGMRIQLQNMPRPKLKFGEIEEIIERVITVGRITVRELEMLYGSVPAALSDCLRSLLIADDGKDLISADFSNIEGRVLAWLAGEHWKLEAFRQYDEGTGPDLYIASYAKAFGVPIKSVTPDQRQDVGKVMELAFGYGGGVGAWRNFDPSDRFTDEQVDQTKRNWRDGHPAIAQFWRDLEDAALTAVRKPGTVQTAGHMSRIKYRVAGSFLWCQLPSGRCLSYAFPKIKKKLMPWTDDNDEPVYKDAIHFMSVDSMTRKWGPDDTYGGKLAENVTQAVARDLLAEAMLRVDPLGYEVVMHVHDEIVAEIPEGFGDLAEFEQLMSILPPWAAGCPVSAAGWRGKRYRKG